MKRILNHGMTNKKITDWNFKLEFIKYCRADVELLSKTVLCFRKLFKTSLDTDPFRYTTLASLCMSVYLNKFLPDKTIMGNTTEKQDSIVCREWLTHLNNPNIKREVPLWMDRNINYNEEIHKGKVGKHVAYYNLSRPFTVDGFDRKTNTIFQFHGCYWHGCQKCYPENQVKYDKTMEQNNYFELNGFNLCQMWECEWNAIKKELPNKNELEQDARQQNIIIRDALFGGRTEGFKAYHKCNEDEKGFYYDIVSLYPTVNALDPYAVGYGNYRKITPDDIINNNFFGIVKCDVIPPKDLLIPVLPDNSEGKLLFHLNPMYNKTYASVELKLALQKGYEIKIHSALEYRQYTGLMKDYVEFFLKIKIENNQHYTPDECRKINESHRAMGFNFEIKSENTQYNPGMKQLAKICLNSLWGKFGQRSTLDSYEYITEWNRLLLQLTNSNVKTNNWHIINNQCVELRYSDDIDYDIEAEYISEVTAVFTIANARVRLYSMLDWLHPSQLIYCDTDSAIFVYDKNNPLHKYPNNDAKDLPDNVRFGDALGEWEDEFKKEGGHIKEIVVGGAKSYSYVTNKDKFVVKQKGITLDRANSNLFTFDKVKNMVLDGASIQSEKRHQFVWNQTTKDVETRYVSRTVQSTLDMKREFTEGTYDTVPFGYKKVGSNYDIPLKTDLTILKNYIDEILKADCKLITKCSTKKNGLSIDKIYINVYAGDPKTPLIIWPEERKIRIGKKDEYIHNREVNEILKEVIHETKQIVKTQIKEFYLGVFEKKNLTRDIGDLILSF